MGSQFSSRKKPKALVIGAGIAGQWMARLLGQRGYRATLIDCAGAAFATSRAKTQKDLSGAPSPVPVKAALEAAVIYPRFGAGKRCQRRLYF